MKLLLIAITLTATAITHAAETTKPNILLVLFDDLGYSDLGCYGGEIPTPNIDALGKGGLRFTHMANSARCCPSRASLLTGLHPAQAGIPNFNGQLSQDTATLPEVLKGAGYQTYMVGKWHVGNSPAASPVARGFDEFYGYTNGHSAGQWEPKNYKRLPAGHEPELKYEPGKYYATDAFSDYAQAFIKEAAKKPDQPWFLYLAHSSPHFPVQAPEKSAAPFYDTYRRGWDVLREERFKRMKDIGLIHSDGWKLSPLSLVPVAPPERANGYPGKPNPDWKSLDAPRREDLAHRMALFAAMVKHVDDGIGRIVTQLKENGTFDNTLILLLSDNGACYEWGPLGFDGGGGSKNTLHEGSELATMGGPGSHMSYGSGWANLGNTPFRLYKHYTHEGGIITPFIAHWPKGISASNRWVRDPGHVMDLMPTLAEVAGATYPKTRDGHTVPPMEGISLAATFRSATAALPERAICIQHEGACSIRKGQWKLVKGKRFPTEAKWELYDILADPCEMTDLATKRPELVTSLSSEWQAWATRTGTPSEATPKAKAKPKANTDTTAKPKPRANAKRKNPKANAAESE